MTVGKTCDLKSLLNTNIQFGIHTLTGQIKTFSIHRAVISIEKITAGLLWPDGLESRPNLHSSAAWLW